MVENWTGKRVAGVKVVGPITRSFGVVTNDGLIWTVTEAVAPVFINAPLSEHNWRVTRWVPLIRLARVKLLGLVDVATANPSTFTEI